MGEQEGQAKGRVVLAVNNGRGGGSDPSPPGLKHALGKLASTLGLILDGGGGDSQGIGCLPGPSSPGSVGRLEGPDFCLAGTQGTEDSL